MDPKEALVLALRRRHCLTESEALDLIAAGMRVKVEAARLGISQDELVDRLLPLVQG
jgi:hypothetical protein